MSWDMALMGLLGGITGGATEVNRQANAEIELEQKRQEMAAEREQRIAEMREEYALKRELEKESYALGQTRKAEEGYASRQDLAGRQKMFSENAEVLGDETKAKQAMIEQGLSTEGLLGQKPDKPVSIKDRAMAVSDGYIQLEDDGTIKPTQTYVPRPTQTSSSKSGGPKERKTVKVKKPVFDASGKKVGDKEVLVYSDTGERVGKSSGTSQASAGSIPGQRTVTQADLEYTAKKHGLTIEQVKQKLGMK